MLTHIAVKSAKTVGLVVGSVIGPHCKTARQPIDDYGFPACPGRAGRHCSAKRFAIPWDGRYPTFIWDAGEIVVTSHRLTLSSIDGIELVGGMYTQPNANRLIARSQGERLLDDIAKLGDLSQLLLRQSP